jgi:hypothetical protein
LTEAVIDWQGHGLEEFLEELKDPRLRGIRFEELRDMAAPHGIEVVRYDQFIRELPEEHQENVPPARAPFFALINPVNDRLRLVVNLPMLFARERSEIAKMIKHELIHMGQLQRRPVGMSVGGWDVRDEGKYLSNQDEIMAFSHSVVEDLIAMGAQTVEEGVRLLPQCKMWKWIKLNASQAALKKYLKYVYLYLRLELEGEV